MMKRVASVLLSMILIFTCMPVLSEAGITYRNFTLSAKAAAPDRFPGLSELMDILTLEGTAGFAEDGDFDIRGDIVLNRTEPFRLPFVFCGSLRNWYLSTPLIGDITFRIDLNAASEFAMKAWNHLQLPLYKAFNLIPYIHDIGTDPVEDELQFVPGSNVSRQELFRIAQRIVDYSENDRRFRYWFQSNMLMSEEDCGLKEELESLPDWVNIVFANAPLKTLEKGGRKTWSVGQKTLLSVSEKDGYISLPAFPVNGYTVEGQYSNMDGILDASLFFGNPERKLIDFTLHGTGMDASPLVGHDFNIDISLEGVLAPFQLALNLTGEEGDPSMIHITDQEQHPLFDLTFSGEVIYEFHDPAEEENQTETEPEPESTEILPELSEEPDIPDDFDPKEFKIFSINESGIPLLADAIKSAVKDWWIPLLIQLPGATCQKLMDFLSEYGILSMALESI